MADRVASIDVLRGIAVLQMIFWQIFDFFAKGDIYSDAPYYTAIFNMPVNGFGLALFTFASGASVYISVTRRLQKNIKVKDIVLHSLKRYGGYILLSLAFTTFVFGFKTFYEWREAIQGVGFAALIASFLILFSKSRLFYLFLGLILAFAQPLIRKIFENQFITANFPLELTAFNFFNNSISLLLNSTIRGFFSLTHALPMLLLGVALAAIMARSNKIRLIRLSFLIGAFMAFISAVMHLSFNRIDIYNWSPAYQIGFSGVSFLLFGLIEYIVLKAEKGKILDIFSLFGKTAVAAYVLHFVLIYKPLKLLNLESTFNQPLSYIITILSIIVIYYICKLWLLNKEHIFKHLKKGIGHRSI